MQHENLICHPIFSLGIRLKNRVAVVPTFGWAIKWVPDWNLNRVSFSNMQPWRVVHRSLPNRGESKIRETTFV